MTKAQQGLMIRRIAAQLVAAMQRIDELTPPGQIGLLVPSIEDVILEAELACCKPESELESQPLTTKVKPRCNEHLNPI